MDHRRQGKGPYHIPEWLAALMGKREWDIVNHPSAYSTNEDNDYPERDCRLPKGQHHFISDIGRFTYDAFRRMIIF